MTTALCKGSDRNIKGDLVSDAVFKKYAVAKGGSVTLRGRVVKKRDVPCDGTSGDLLSGSTIYEEKRNTLQPVYRLTAGLTNNAVIKARDVRPCSTWI